jgi:hypothetical protein
MVTKMTQLRMSTKQTNKVATIITVKFFDNGVSPSAIPDTFLSIRTLSPWLLVALSHSRSTHPIGDVITGFDDSELDDDVTVEDDDKNALDVNDDVIVPNDVIGGTLLVGSGIPEAEMDFVASFSCE